MQLEFDLINDGRGIGADTDERLHVIAIGQGGPADGKLQLGDVILAINDISITSKSHLENTILSVGSSIKVRVSRAGGDSSNAHNVEPVENDCTAMTEVILKYTVGSKQKLGLGVSSVNDKIRVSKVLRGSVADDLLHEGDIIDEIDGVRPTSKEHTRNLLVGALKKNGQVVLKVTCLLCGEKKGDEPSVMMKSDVLEIAQRQKERLLNLRGENKPAIRGILGRYTRPPDQRDDKRLNVETEHHSLMIGMDPVDHPLMHVKQEEKGKDDSSSE
uniref:PDZ domain-containing protein n=1 Tax=Ascaris lumbricoides TaxID=6252 RepID=A0A9J2PJE9_ASCLU